MFNSTMRDEIMKCVDNPLVSDRIQEDKNREKARDYRRAKEMRDRLILRIREVSYSRNGRLIPRKKEYKEVLASLQEQAKFFAQHCRPDNGYPVPPSQRPNVVNRDKEYPEGTVDFPRKLDVEDRQEEYERLSVWKCILVSRNAHHETIARVNAHLARLQKMISEKIIVSNGSMVVVEYKR